MKLTTDQVYAFTVRAGFHGEAAIVMTAIVAAESSNHTDSRGDVNLTVAGEVSIGLGQINYRPKRDAGNAVRDPQANLDPLVNLQHCLVISGNGKNFRPWSTFTNGAYKRYLDAARAAAHAHPTTAPGVPPKGHPPTPVPAPGRHYTIKAGDTLSAIAAAHHTTVAQLLAKNGTQLDATARRHGQASSNRGNLIYPGQTIAL